MSTLPTFATMCAQLFLFGTDPITHTHTHPTHTPPHPHPHTHRCCFCIFKAVASGAPIEQVALPAPIAQVAPALNNEQVVALFDAVMVGLDEGLDEVEEAAGLQVPSSQESVMYMGAICNCVECKRGRACCVDEIRSADDAQPEIPQMSMPDDAQPETPQMSMPADAQPEIPQIPIPDGAQPETMISKPDAPQKPPPIPSPKRGGQKLQTAKIRNRFKVKTAVDKNGLPVPKKVVRPRG